MSRALTWLVLAVPAVWWTAAFATGRQVYGEYVHHTGLLSLQLVILALAITPVCRWLPRAGLSAWLRRSRRYIGVASFAYLALHTGAYLLRQPWARILSEGTTLAYSTAWVAFVFMLLLALTSNNGAVRSLGIRWKQLHRTVYLAAGLAFAHWILTAYDPSTAYGWLALLLLLEGSRLVQRGKSSA